MKTKLLLTIFALVANFANAQWYQIGSGATINTMAVTGAYPSNIIYLGLPDHGLVYTSNYGSAWQDTEYNSDWFWASNTSVYSIAQTGSQIVVGTQYGGEISNGTTCSSWTKMYNSNLSSDIYYFAASGSKLFAASNYQIFISTDYASTWTQVHLFNPIETVYSIAMSGTKVYVGASDGIWYSANNGSTWTYYQVGSPVKAITISGTTIFLGTPNGIYKSTNNGASCLSINTGLTNTDVTSIVINGTRIFAGTMGGGVFQSTDNGNNWTGFSTGWYGAEFYVVALATQGQYLYAGNGNGVWMTNILYADVNEIDNALQLNIYPNPFTNFTAISFSKEQNNTTIKILDIIGKVISTQNFSGTEFILEKEDLKEGVYFIQAIDENKNVMNKKIVIQ